MSEAETISSAIYDGCVSKTSTGEERWIDEDGVRSRKRGEIVER